MTVQRSELAVLGTPGVIYAHDAGVASYNLRQSSSELLKYVSENDLSGNPQNDDHANDAVEEFASFASRVQHLNPNGIPSTACSAHQSSPMSVRIREEPKGSQRTPRGVSGIACEIAVEKYD